MPVIKCPECRKSLKVNDTFAGKRIRCPACKKPFVVPEEPVVLEEVEEVEEVQEKRITARPRRKVEEEEEERPRRPNRRRSRDDDREEISASSSPLIYGILSIVFSCAPLIGLILGRLAMSKADEELDRLPGSKRARAARKQLKLAKTLGIIGMCLSTLALVVAIVLTIRDYKK